MNVNQTLDGGATPTRALQISPCSLLEIREFVETNHYSRSVNGVTTRQCFKVEMDNELVGAVIFGPMATTAWRKFGSSEEKVIELRRLVLLDRVPKNSESKVIGYTLRQIRKLLPLTEIVVSYADPRFGHCGTIYKASNFKYLGVSSPDSGYRDTETGKVYHSRSLRVKYKGDFKPFVKKLRAKLALGLLEKVPLPPKHCFVYYL